MARGAQLSQNKKSVSGQSKARRDREMVYVYLRACRQASAPEGKWFRPGVYRCATIFKRKRNTVKKCIRATVECGQNSRLATAVAGWVPSARPFVAGTADDRRYLQLDEATLLAALSSYIRGEA